MDQAQHLSTQLEGMERLVDGYTLKFISATLLCVDIHWVGHGSGSRPRYRHKPASMASSSSGDTSP